MRIRVRLSQVMPLAFAFWQGTWFFCRADIEAKIEKKPPPEAVSAALKETLDERCVQILEDGAPLFEFWFRSGVPLQEHPASVEKGLDTLPTASLLGVVRIAKALRDYRDDDLSKGVHTLRFGKIPADGNHLGASQFPYFAVLIPVAKDTTVDGITTFKKLTQASAEETASEHPMVMSLRPVKEKPENAPALTEPAPEHKAIVVSLQGQPEGGDKVELWFEIVYEGIGEI